MLKLVLLVSIFVPTQGLKIQHVVDTNPGKDVKQTGVIETEKGSNTGKALKAEAPSINKRAYGNYGTFIEHSNLDGDVYYPQTIEELRRGRRFKEEPLSKGNPTAIVYQYPNMSEYKIWNGSDFTPSNRPLLDPKSNWLKTRAATTELTLGTIDIGPDENKFSWTIQRIGPLVSTGCYDWWQFATHDFLSLSRFLKEGQLQLSGHYVVGSDEEGNALSYPPIHIHHVHVVTANEKLRFQYPNPGLDPNDNQNTWEDTFKRPPFGPYYLPAFLIEWHGEWDSCHVRPETGCFWEQYPAGYGLTVEDPLDLEGEVNDARACNSEPLTWYFELGVRWSRPETHELRPLSKLTLIENTIGILRSDQTNYENYFWTPTVGKVFRWGNGKFQLRGKLLRIKHHVHMTSLNRTLLLRGTSDMLGLNSLPVSMPSLGDPFRYSSLEQAGMATFDDLETYLVQKARQAGIAQPYICTVYSGLRHVDDLLYDYPGHSVGRPTRVEVGDPFTSVSFHEFHPGSKKMPWQDEVPQYVPNHNQWFVMIDTEDDTTHSLVWHGSMTAKDEWWMNVQNGDSTMLATRVSFLTHWVQRKWKKLLKRLTRNLAAFSLGFSFLCAGSFYLACKLSVKLLTSKD